MQENKLLEFLFTATFTRVIKRPNCQNSTVFEFFDVELSKGKAHQNDHRENIYGILRVKQLYGSEKETVAGMPCEDG